MNFNLLRLELRRRAADLDLDVGVIAAIQTLRLLTAILVLPVVLRNVSQRHRLF